jgi:hypothetical protein
MSVGVRALQLCICVLTLSLSLPNGIAAAVPATSCAAEAVQSAINSASIGATILVPAGNCTWTTAVSIPNDKKITLQGAGPTATVITRSPSGRVVNMNQSGSRVTGFTFNSGTINVDGDDWRIDHNRFTAMRTFFDSILVRGDRANTHPRGLIDHNEFLGGARVAVIGWSNLAAHAIWAQPLGLGAQSGQKVFVEDNTFTYSVWSGVFDTNYGGRFVFRHNTVTNGYVEVHSLQQGRASRSWEIYDNTFAQSGVSLWAPFFIRGGTGVVYNNNVTGAWGDPSIIVDNVRSFDTGNDYGMCSGASPADGNELSNGWPCRDQIGRSTDQSLWTTQNPYPSQTSDPAYFWNNTANGNAMTVTVHNNTAAWIRSGRDFFNNTQRPGYSPYPYPHPLTQQSAAPSPPSAPTNLTVR